MSIRYYGTVPVAHVLSVLHDGQLLVVSCLQFHVRVTAGPVPAHQREIQCCGPCGSGNNFFSDPDSTFWLVSDPKFSKIFDINFYLCIPAL